MRIRGPFEDPEDRKSRLSRAFTRGLKGLKRLWKHLQMAFKNTL
jgi:hypothetical protein